MSRNAAIAKPARSCRPPHCWRRRRTHLRPKSMTRWRPQSAAAVVISASPPPSRRLPQERDMTSVHTVIENVSRRGFLKGVLATGSLVIAAKLVPARAALAGYATGAEKMPHGVRSDPHLFVSIAPDGIVTIVAIRSEMGTGSRTSLPMIVADELEADWAGVRGVQAPGDEEKYGNQDTDGSRSLRHHIQPMRQCGAAARQMLETAAAKRWGVDPGEVRAQNHEVVHKASGRKPG